MSYATSVGTLAVASKVAEWICTEFERVNAVKIGPASIHFMRILEAARKAIPVLATLPDVDVRVDDVVDSAGIAVTLTRELLQEKYVAAHDLPQVIVGVQISSRAFATC